MTAFKSNIFVVIKMEHPNTSSNSFAPFMNKVKLSNKLSNSFNIVAGIRPRCILDPLLFNVYIEYIMRLILINWKAGVIDGRKMGNVI